jgi:small subunit ribosomal protein S6
MIILEPTLEAEAIDALITRFSDLVNNNGGKLENINKWGRRRLAYQIGQNNEGYYTIMTFQGENQTIDELDRVLKITDGVIRHMIVRLES